jgi:hypothetical protein
MEDPRGYLHRNAECFGQRLHGAWLVGRIGYWRARHSSTPSNEASGGSPAYARIATTWGSTSGGANTGSAVTINVSSATYTYMILASNSSGNNMQDNCSITSVTMGAQGQIVVTPTYTQT